MNSLLLPLKDMSILFFKKCNSLLIPWEFHIMQPIALTPQFLNILLSSLQHLPPKETPSQIN